MIKSICRKAIAHPIAFLDHLEVVQGMSDRDF
jgi:hypothetical protein